MWGERKVTGYIPGSPCPMLVSCGCGSRLSNSRQHKWPCSPGGQKSNFRFLELKPRRGQGQFPPGALEEDPLPLLPRLPVAICIPWPVVPLPTSKACLPLSICTFDHLLPIRSHNPPPTSAYNDPSDSVKAHLVKPGPSLHPRVFLQIPSSKSLLLYWVPFTGPRIGTWISLEAVIPPPTRCTKRRRPIAPGGSLTPCDFCPG